MSTSPTREARRGIRPGGGARSAERQAMRAVCFHGRRERGGGGDFLLAARMLGAGASRAGLSAQVRTPTWPSPPGSPDWAAVRLAAAPLEDMEIPRRFHLEVICDPLLAVVPPAGGALLPEGRLLVNATAPPASPAGGPKIASADLSALAERWGAPLCFALAGAAWAGLAAVAPELSLPLRAMEEASLDLWERPLEAAPRALLLAAHAQMRERVKE